MESNDGGDGNSNGIKDDNSRGSGNQTSTTSSSGNSSRENQEGGGADYSSIQNVANQFAQNITVNQMREVVHHVPRDIFAHRPGFLPSPYMFPAGSKSAKDKLALGSVDFARSEKRRKRTSSGSSGE